MKKEKTFKVLSIIADVVMFLCLATLIAFCLICLTGISDGVNSGLFGQGEKAYDLEAYLLNFLFMACFVVYFPILPAILIYDVAFLVVKLVRKTLKPYEIAGLIATLLIVVAGFVIVLVAVS